MILSGPEIKAMRAAGQIVIEPYSDEFVEPNSYAFHLGTTLLQHEDQVIDPKTPSKTKEIVIPNAGFVLEPGFFYLGHTLERIGGLTVTSELFGNHSTAAMGMWVQMSAPLGHVGAVIRWTLEICVTQPLRVYPNMRLGKVCFWRNLGHIHQYEGRYADSTGVVASRIFMDKT